ncbi:MAG: GIY-YIG nuclease family protein, partial [Chthonomonadaceae bacterium]|nr:GIY-YIG nuclease family protein [Chthonomonadaceae bacterium]
MRKSPLPDALSEKLQSLPTKPGCYIYRDEGGVVLYVGKAVNLKNRVRSYFQKGAKLGAKNERMVRKVRDLETIVVDSELEAL